MKTLKSIVLLVGVLIAVAAVGSNFKRLLGITPTPAQVRVDTAIVRVHTTDTLYMRDTIRYAVARDHYKVLRDGTTVHDTVLVAAADTALAKCDSSLASGNARVAARDTLIKLVTVGPPRFLRTIDAAYSPVGRPDLSLRAEAGVRLTPVLSIYAAAEKTLTTGPRLWVGVRKSF